MQEKELRSRSIIDTTQAPKFYHLLPVCKNQAGIMVNT